MRPVLLIAMCAVALIACNLSTGRAPSAEIPPTEIPVVFPTWTPFLDPSTGAMINIPEGANPNCPPPSGWVAYTVETGDSLSALAEAVEIPLSELTQANCLDDPNQIYGGQVLFLPRFP